MKKVMFVVLIMMLLLAMAIPAFAAPAEKVDVCHSTSSETNEWVLINVSENAFSAHVDHGDAGPGDDVPGMEGFAFDDTCTPEMTSLALEGCFEFEDNDFIGSLYVNTDGSVIQNIHNEPIYREDAFCTRSNFAGGPSTWVIWAETEAETLAICNGGTVLSTPTPNLWWARNCDPLP